MISLKKRFNDFRLYDTKNGKYVPFNAENRSRALFCMLARNEAHKHEKTADELYSIDELANMYGTILYEFRTFKQIDEIAYDAFMYMLNRKVGIADLTKNEGFNKLALCVLNDQLQELTQTNIYDIETLKQDYRYFDAAIFKRHEIEDYEL